ncbi:MAG: amino acid ABC transporter permease [Clostridia bacterium]|nr:amino acid ABC transporter permease [Clostridia bacterium]
MQALLENINQLFNFSGFMESFPELLRCIPVTLGIGLLSFAIGLVIGLLVALVRIYKVPVLQGICKFYISFVRGTPLVVQLFMANYGVARIIYYLQMHTETFANFNANVIKPEYYGLLAFSLNLGAYLSETIRSAIEAVDRGQFEAAKSIGMTGKQMMQRIILPQAARVALPNLNNTLINTVKDTSLLFTIGIIDLMGRAKIYGARTLHIFEGYIAVSVLYWIISFAFEKAFTAFEKKLKASEREID